MVEGVREECASYLFEHIHVYKNTDVPATSRQNLCVRERLSRATLRPEVDVKRWEMEEGFLGEEAEEGEEPMPSCIHIYMCVCVH